VGGFEMSREDADAVSFQRLARVAVLGISVRQPCGVHDHAALLAQTLSGDDLSCSLHWLWRRELSLRPARAEIRAWTRGLAAELERSQPDAVVLHYSVFAYSYRGTPLFVHPTLSAVRRSRIPLITVLHEYAYPWTYGGWRGKAWALTQRAALIEVMRASTAVIVTVDSRVQWLASRRWLPQRPVALAPVFSNLPVGRSEPPSDRSRHTLGLFGYAYEGAAVLLVLDAIRALKDRGVEVQLSLLGAPGRSSSSAEEWLAAARARDIAPALSFSGTLAAQDLADALAACDVLLFTDASGPSSRKTTLAASLASGRPVVAIDGRHRWSEIVRSQAAEVVEPTSDALADAIADLLADESRRERLGARGRVFAEQKMSVARSAGVVRALLGDILQ